MCDIVISVASIFTASTIAFLISKHFFKREQKNNALDKVFELINSSMKLYGNTNWTFMCKVNLSLIERYNKRFLKYDIQDSIDSINREIDENGAATKIVEKFRNLFDTISTYEYLENK